MQQKSTKNAKEPHLTFAFLGKKIRKDETEKRKDHYWFSLSSLPQTLLATSKTCSAATCRSSAACTATLLDLRTVGFLLSTICPKLKNAPSWLEDKCIGAEHEKAWHVHQLLRSASRNQLLGAYLTTFQAVLKLREESKIVFRGVKQMAQIY